MIRQCFDHGSEFLFTKKRKRYYKVCFYKVMIVPVLLYGCENWTLTKEQQKKTEAAKIRLLRDVDRGFCVFIFRRTELLSFGSLSNGQNVMSCLL